MTHTPGPWIHHRDQDGSDIIGPDGFHVGRVEDMGPGGDDDGRLLAGAPEMLAMLQELVEHGMVAAPGPHFRWPDEYYKLFDKARKIIADLEI